MKNKKPIIIVTFLLFIGITELQAQESKKITDNETTIALKDFIPATYFLKVTHKNQDIILFKIVKR